METAATPVPAPARYEHLDGLRGLAAWYVVIHHIWLYAYQSFPDNLGPPVLALFRWGHFAVAVFIVLSGFSLMLAPARKGDQLGSYASFMKRRAWRILPPYWVALVASTLVAALYVDARSGASMDVKGFAVHAALLHDVIGAKSPNGAFWSIAVEWQIYFLLPLLLWVVRKQGAAVMVAVTTAVVITAQLLGTDVAAMKVLTYPTPQFLAMFAMGVVAARAVVRHAASDAVRRRWPLATGAVVTLGAVVLVIALMPPQAVVDQFFWVDLAVGGVTTLWLYVLGIGAFPNVASLLGRRWCAHLGSFSYSTYLMHAPVLLLVYYGLAVPMTSSTDRRFLVLLVVSIPAVLVVTYLFHVAFERPFVRYRSVPALGDAARSWWVRRVPVLTSTARPPTSSVVPSDLLTEAD